MQTVIDTIEEVKNMKPRKVYLTLYLLNIFALFYIYR